MNQFAFSFLILWMINQAGNGQETYFSFPFAAKVPDLVIMEIEEPEWNGDSSSSEIRVKIKNAGKAASNEATAILSDYDPGLNELRKLPLETTFKTQLIKNYKEVVEDEFHADIQDVPPLQPGESFSALFIFENYWVYDPICELLATVSEKGISKERNLKNNQLYFLSSR